MLIKFDLAWIFLWYCRSEIWSFRNLDWIDFVAMTNQFRNLGTIPKRFTGDITCSSHWNHWPDWPRDACKGKRYIQVFYQESHALWTEPGKGLHWHPFSPLFWYLVESRWVSHWIYGYLRNENTMMHQRKTKWSFFFLYGGPRYIAWNF